MNITKAKLVKNEFNNTIDHVYLTIDNIVYLVPFDPLNTDYQEYLAWLDGGNVAEPAD